jgi:hypothetical protein
MRQSTTQRRNTAEGGSPRSPGLADDAPTDGLSDESDEPDCDSEWREAEC